MGGFFDGIVLHQLLQWHHVVSQPHPPDTLAALQVNTLWDGVFHAGTWLAVLAGLVLLWRQARRGQVLWGWRGLAGGLLTGFGAFNLVEGVVNHHLLELHHVNETAPPQLWPLWDGAFLIWGAVMLAVGVVLLRQAR